MRSDARLLLLDKDAVDALLDPEEVLQAVRRAFELRSLREGRGFPVIRELLSNGGIFGIKGGDAQSRSLLGFKAAGFWPGNRERDAEPHQATILLFDPETGRPHCVIDGNAITAVRTGAAGALGLQILARPESECLTVFGTGVQARAQLSFALRTLPGLRRVHYVSVDRKPDREFESLFENACELQCAPCADSAVAESDVVITATPGGGPLFNAHSIRPGTHINCIGADTRGKRELPQGLLERTRLFVDDRLQALQLGETQWAQGMACDELGDLLTGKAALSRNPGDVTVFDMTGLALQDMMVAQSILDKATAANAGISIAWPW